MRGFEFKKKAFPREVNQNQYIVIEMPDELEDMTVDGIIEDKELRIHRCVVPFLSVLHTTLIHWAGNI